MSRSYRKPYIYVCGLRASSHSDKTVASRSYRRLANTYTRDHVEAEDDFLIPDRLEANYNDPWGWSRDGSAWWMGGRDLRLLTYLGIPEEERWPWINRWLAEPGSRTDDVVEYSRK